MASRPPVFLLALLLALPALPALAVPMPALPEVDPDVPAALPPVAVVEVLDDEVWSFTAGFRGRDILVPDVAWDRVVLVFTQRALGDPWDRLFAASIAGAEVLRGTTPRAAEMVVSKDVTGYEALLPPGGTVRVEGYTDTYVGAMAVDLRLEFYDDPAPPAELVWDAVVPVTRFNGFCTNTARSFQVELPEDAPASAAVEFYLSGHGTEEFWFLNGLRARVFHVLVDGQEVAQAVAMPYTYAFLGFADGGTGQQSPTTYLVHQAAWWTAQQALDVAGVPDGVGEIPPYRAVVAPEDLALLQGARTIEVRLDTLPAVANAQCVWVTSVNLLLDA